jgi:H+/Cl- antiporter ClcA
MAFPDKLSQLCTPSLVYFVISVVGMVVSIFQNMGNKTKYCLGSFACNVPSTIAVFIVKIVCILFWARDINLMCKDGHSNIAWFLVLLPFIFLFIIFALVSMYQGENKKKNQKQKKQIVNSGDMGSAASSTMPYEGFASTSALIEGMISSSASKKSVKVKNQIQK